ncbi:MAG: DUF4968 domain-containing protein, partial [Anaerolineae bacterium]|nr:DUF4968 domain-containing protein [Anaerolineae bacterium]NIQ77317.1 DUF4968 domain-containing protein [Anaerolineae bacterium]
RGRQTRGSPLRGVRAVLGLGRPPAEEQPGSYTFPGRLLAHRWHTPDMGSRNQQFVLTCENATVQITFLAPDLIRVRVSPTGQFSAPFSYAVAKGDDEWRADEWSAIKCSLEETEDALIIRTSRVHCHVAKAH